MARIPIKQHAQSGATEGQVARWRTSSDAWIPEALPNLPDDALVFPPTVWVDSDETPPEDVTDGGYQQARDFVNTSDLEFETYGLVVRDTKGSDVATGTLKAAIVLSSASASTLGIAVESNLNGAGFSAVTGSPFTVTPAASTSLQIVSIGSVTLAAGDVIALRFKRNGSTDSSTADVALVALWIDYAQDGTGENVHFAGRFTHGTQFAASSGSNHQIGDNVGVAWTVDSDEHSWLTDDYKFVNPTGKTILAKGEHNGTFSGSATSYRRLDIAHFNSSDVLQARRSNRIEPSGTTQESQFSATFKLASGDYLVMGLRQQSGVSVNYTPNYAAVTVVEIL